MVGLLTSGYSRDWGLHTLMTSIAGEILVVILVSAMATACGNNNPDNSRVRPPRRRLGVHFTATMIVVLKKGSERSAQQSLNSQ